MKTQTENMLVTLNKVELNQLTLEVKETIAINIPIYPKVKKVFTSADLWKIQRFSRTSLVKPILVY